MPNESDDSILGSEQTLVAESTEGSVGHDERRALFHPGEILANTYHVRRLLGEGGMGQVFEAYEPMLKRMVAIKASWSHVDADRLHREALVLASLRHPSVVSIHGMGAHRTIDYMVMERLYGLTLKDHIARRQDHSFAMSETLDILASLADALAYIHRNGIVHRDLKPANVMVENQSRLVLMDFGLVARSATPNLDVSGSPHYIAPETIRGNEINPLMDIYALGVLAFELITGHKPFEGVSVNEILTKHLREAPPDIMDERSDVSVHLSRLIGEMLAKDPAGRPQSASVIAMWLKALQRGRTLPGGQSQMSVLIVDDDPDMRGLLCACVEHSVPNLRITTAENGMDALHQFRARPPDLMLVDLEMPEMSGLELCMYLRGTTLGDNTSVIAVSAHDSGDERRLLSQLGVAHFISKRKSSDKFLTDLMELVQQTHENRARLLRKAPGAPRDTH